MYLLACCSWREYLKNILNNGALNELLFLTHLGTIVHNCFMSSFYEKTIELLQKTEKPMSEIATNADVGLRWLYDLKEGRFPDPSVNRIERIYKYLANNDYIECNCKDAA